MWLYNLLRCLSLTVSAVFVACVSTSVDASRVSFPGLAAPPGLAVSLERFVHLQGERNWSEVAKMLAPSYLASTSQTSETVVLNGVHPLVRLEILYIKAPEPELPGIWFLEGCAEFDRRGLNSKYYVHLMVEKVQEDWKFWFPEAATDCIDCPVVSCRFQRQRTAG
jgi:hypothetical protein